MLQHFKKQLNCSQEAVTSRALKDIDPTVLEDMQRDPVGYYFHTKCLTLDMYDGILSEMKVLATNHDLDNKQYATFVEHRKYPFYATQFHPEKIVYEWNPRTSVERPLSGILMNQHLANFFKSEAAKSNHRFINPADFHARKIDNYPAINTMLMEYTILTTYYFFDDKSYGKPEIDYSEVDKKFELIDTLVNRQAIKY